MAEGLLVSLPPVLGSLKDDVLHVSTDKAKGGAHCCVLRKSQHSALGESARRGTVEKVAGNRLAGATELCEAAISS